MAERTELWARALRALDPRRKSFSAPIPAISYGPYGGIGGGAATDPYGMTNALYDPLGPGSLAYGPMGQGALPGWLPSTHVNYARLAGDPSDNSLVAAILKWVCRTFVSAQLVVRAGGEGDEVAVDRHPMVELVRRPNDFYTGLDLWSGTLRSYNLDGNAYWFKLRDGYRQVTELWYLPHWLVTPVGPRDGKILITHYEYRAGGNTTEPMRFARGDIVHFRNGIDPMNPRVGISDVKVLLREIFTDNEAANYTASLVRNSGVPGVILTPDVTSLSALPGKEQLEQIKADYMRKFGGDRRGEPMVLSGPMKAQPVAFSPKDMALTDLRRVPEERVAAVMGVQPGVVGFGAGLDRNTYSNYDAALRASWENNILPTQMFAAATLDHQLLPDMGDPAAERTAFATDHVKVLRDDENKVYERLALWYREGILKRSEPRRAMGWPTGPEDEVYRTDLIAVRETETVALDQPVTNADESQAAAPTNAEGPNTGEEDDA